MSALATEQPTVGAPTPWGAADDVAAFGGLAVLVSTPGHGGFWLAPDRFERLPDWARETFAGGNWYEEDIDWAIPYLACRLDRFDGARGARNLAAARDTLRMWRKHEPCEIEGACIGQLGRIVAHSPAE